MRTILWLQDIEPNDLGMVGPKACTLAEIARAGFSVPAGFCVTTAAYQQYVVSNGLEPVIRELLTLPENKLHRVAMGLQKAIRAGRLNPQTRQEIASAYRTLAHAQEAQCPLAVRSSATAEDLPTASFAGQQATFLNVRGERQLLKALQECWASLWSSQAIVYRARYHRSESPPLMAVLVQRMIEADTAGVAFSQHPVDGRDTLVIEAGFGLGQTVVSGEGDVDRYCVTREALSEFEPPLIAHKSHRRVLAAQGGLQIIDVPAEERDARALTAPQVQEIARTVMALEGQLGCPQDMEWAYLSGQLYVLQSRPITAQADSFFTDVLPRDEHIWTSGFLNERFALPVSPLGWSVIRELLDELAFRAPLRYLGLKSVETLPITKLYRGHPYVNMFVFQTLYKVFPDSLLPEDAYRYFPEGKTGLRRDAPYPLSLLDPRFVLSMVWHFLRQPKAWSPWHNDQLWAAFVQRHDGRSQVLQAACQSLRECKAPLQQIWAAIEEAQQLNRELLSLHRWSLTDADLTYSLLRRLVRAWAEEKEAAQLSTRLVAGLPNKSLETNRALQQLARIADPAAFREALDAFLQTYGHRSFHLDIYYPTFADDPAQVLELVERVREVDHAIGVEKQQRALAKDRVHALCGAGPAGWLKRAIFDHLLDLAQRYMPLREDQRFYWQKTLAQQRQLFLLLGQRMAEEGTLRHASDIYFLAKPELEAHVRGWGSSDCYPALAETRKVEFARLCQEFEAAPGWSYPPFLKGNQPLKTDTRHVQGQLRGHAVSPGLARGRVVVLFSPARFDQIQEGDVLVTRSVDPGWTPIFSRLGALVTEHGGQLSHGAVVAREYGLPAVVGIPGITRLLHDGDTVIVDGLSGVVAKVSES